MENRFSKSFIQATSGFKKSTASVENIEKLYDLIYEMEKAEKNLDETIMLCKIYNLLGLNFITNKILDSIKLSSQNEEKRKLDAQKKLDKENKYKDTRFYYRDLRQAKIKKDAVTLSREDFVIISREDDTFKIEFAEIKRLNVLNKYVKTKDIYIYSKQTGNKPILDELIYFFHWLSECKEELINFYNSNKIECKINNVGIEWFDGLDVWDLIIEIKEKEKIFCAILVTDYCNHNFGFELEINDNSIISIEYNPIL